MKTIGFVIFGLVISVFGYRWWPSPAPSRPQPGLGQNGSIKEMEKHRGVSWVAGSPITLENLQPLAGAGVNWIVQTPFGWQRNHRSARVVLATSGRILWGESDRGLAETARMARSLGIKTLLKPHLWLTRSEDGKWRGHIEMENEEDWRSWFHDYRVFILHYAELAEAQGMEGLCIGTELHQTAVKREADWRALIGEIRGIYHGRLTYAANWYREFEEVSFWDDLDWIGIQAYFPLADHNNPTLETLKAGWEPHLKAIENLGRRYGKPVIFTEIGYRSMENAAVEPWLWPGRGVSAADEGDLETQARCYRAFFESVWTREWLGGVYFWKWFPRISSRKALQQQGFTPQNKPAEQVLRQYFTNAKE